MKIVIISWKANSWKTTLRKYLEEKINLIWISWSDYTKSQTNDFSRESLENIFNKNVEDFWFDWLAKKIVDFWFKDTKNWLIDWFRHKKIIQWVINYVWKENCLVIYIKISQKNRYKLSKLWNKAESINLEQFKNFEKNSTHENKTSHIKNIANIIIWDEIVTDKENTYKNIENKIFDFLNK